MMPRCSPTVRVRCRQDTGFHADLKRGAAAHFQRAGRRSRSGGAAVHTKMAILLVWFGVSCGLFLRELVPVALQAQRPAPRLRPHRWDWTRTSMPLLPSPRALPRHQHVHAWPLCGLLAITWWLVDNLVDLVRGCIQSVAFPPFTGRQLSTRVAGKVVFVTRRSSSPGSSSGATGSCRSSSSWGDPRRRPSSSPTPYPTPSSAWPSRESGGCRPAGRAIRCAPPSTSRPAIASSAGASAAWNLQLEHHLLLEARHQHSTASGHGRGGMPGAPRSRPHAADAPRRRRRARQPVRPGMERAPAQPRRRAPTGARPSRHTPHRRARLVRADLWVRAIQPRRGGRSPGGVSRTKRAEWW